MSRARCTFTQEAVTRALRAAVVAGVDVRIEIETSGKIVLVPIDTKPVEPEPKPADQIVL